MRSIGGIGGLRAATPVWRRYVVWLVSSGLLPWCVVCREKLNLGSFDIARPVPEIGEDSADAVRTGHSGGQESAKRGA